MLRKKNSAKEESKEGQENESPDNKTNRETVDQADQVSDADSAEDAQEGESSGQTGQETDSTDKVSPDENKFQEKLAEMQDRYIRLSAEFDNYRKRTLREKMELTKYASENILLKLLPFMDDFDRALKNTEDVKDAAAIRAGIELINTKFVDFLKQNGVTEVEAQNCVFNFDLHDAVAKVQVDDENMKGKIVDVVLKGYYLQDKVIRHSKVVVGE